MISKEKLTQKLSIWGFVSWPLKKKGRKSLRLGLPPASQAGAKNLFYVHAQLSSSPFRKWPQLMRKSRAEGGGSVCFLLLFSRAGNHENWFFRSRGRRGWKCCGGARDVEGLFSAWLMGLGNALADGAFLPARGSSSSSCHTSRGHQYFTSEKGGRREEAANDYRQKARKSNSTLPFLPI